ncbi:MAG TPA: integrase arm-type DNA-binding domain-containing protein [Mesorhizobium sp.]|jgi:integrase|uniref:tyrosine-type recombinase/integrase n=1 Tax=Mesorhizobium sp. TaxID=1871066 RepID=UPI002DDD03B7|nr:integrase arm-type DNA-binding domain-containing protein [Mesorhizobium sp.]HEV2505145.1 integrase arm-type DNA-binding domain-containing protein [Mesorhizobium sp.]
MPLSDFACKNAKPKDKPYRLADGDGLYLFVQKSGAKLWQLRYRFLEKENILSFGKYPVVSLLDAREKRDQAKRLLVASINPSTKRKEEKIAAITEARTTFGLIAEEYIRRLAERKAASTTITKTKWLLEDLASPLAKRPIKEITAAEILQFLQRIEKSGRRETARRLRGVISSVFRLAIVTLRAESDPTLALRGALQPPKSNGRAAIIDERKFGRLLVAIDEYDGWPTLRAALQFLALTCVRPGEVRGATRDEFDREKAVWRIPAERMKMRVPHDVPLSRQALRVLDEVWPHSASEGLAFPSIRSIKRPLSENAMNAALRRIGYSKSEVTAHGFRVTASTILNARNYDPDVIEAVLAHQDKNTIRRTYNRATYWEQRVTLMQKWADLLDTLKGEL